MRRAAEASQAGERSKSIVAALKPLIPAVLAPVVEPVIDRLDRHEELLLSLKAALDVQFQRIAAMQAQLDALLGANRPPKK